MVGLDCGIIVLKDYFHKTFVSAINERGINFRRSVHQSIWKIKLVHPENFKLLRKCQGGWRWEIWYTIKGSTPLSIYKFWRSIYYIIYICHSNVTIFERTLWIWTRCTSRHIPPIKNHFQMRFWTVKILQSLITFIKAKMWSKGNKYIPLIIFLGIVTYKNGCYETFVSHRDLTMVLDYKTKHH